MVTNDVNVSLDKEIKQLKPIDENGNDPLMVAIIENNLELVKKLFEENENLDLNVKNNDGNTALHLAIKGENESILKFILNYPLKFNNRNNNNDNAITLAMNCKNENILNILLEKNPKFSFKKKKDGKVPLVIAVDEKKFSTAMQLIRYGATTLVKDSEGTYILFKLLELEDEFEEIFKIEVNNKIEEKEKKEKKDDKSYEEQIMNILDGEGNTLLLRACKENRKKVLKFLLTKNPDTKLNNENNNGDNAIVLATKEKNSEILKMLLDYHDVDTYSITTNNEKSLFQIAIENQDKDTLKVLLDHTDNYYYFTSKCLINNLLIMALDTGNPGVVDVIANKININAPINVKGETPLLYLVEKVKEEIIEAEQYYRDLYIKNKERKARSKEATPVTSDHEVIEVEKSTEENKVNNESSEQTDEDTLKDITSSEETNNEEIIVRNNIAVMEEPQEEKSETKSEEKSETKSEEKSETKSEEKNETKPEEKSTTGKSTSVRPTRRKLTVKRTYSSYEKMAESEKKIQDILNSSGTINEKFTSIENAYNTNRRLLNGDRYWKAKDKTYVIESNYLEIIKSLLLRKANINIKNSKEEAALHIACRFGLRNILETILQYGKGYDVNSVDGSGNTPLHYACYGKYSSLVKILLREDLIDVNVTDLNGDSPLMIAVYNNHSDTVLELLKFPKTSIDMLNKVLETPLIAACRLNYYNIAKILIDRNANINNRYDANGETALFHSIRNGSKILTKYLLNKKACITYINKNGQTPMDLAIECDNKEVINILQKHIDMEKNLSRRYTDKYYIPRNSSRYSSGKPSPDLKPYHPRVKSENSNFKLKPGHSLHQYRSENSSPKTSLNEKFKLTSLESEESTNGKTSSLMMEPSPIYDTPEDVSKSIHGALSLNVVKKGSSIMMQEPSSIYEEIDDTNSPKTVPAAVFSEPQSALMQEPSSVYEEPAEEKKDTKPKSHYSNIKFRPNTKFNVDNNGNGSTYNKNRKPFKPIITNSPYLKNIFVSPKANTTYIKKVYNSTKFPATYSRVNSENSMFDKKPKSPVAVERTDTSDKESKEIPILNDDIKGLRFSCYFGDIDGVESYLQLVLKEKNLFQLPESLHTPGSTEPPNIDELKTYNKTREGYITLDHVEMFAFSLICNGVNNDKLLEIMLRYGMNPNIQNNALYTLLILACIRDKNQRL